MTTPRRRGRRQGQEEQAHQTVEVATMEVPLHWADADVKDFVFANQIFVRYLSGAYWLTFGQIHGPYEVELNAEQRQRRQEEGVVA